MRGMYAILSSPRQNLRLYTQGVDNSVDNVFKLAAKARGCVLCSGLAIFATAQQNVI